MFQHTTFPSQATVSRGWTQRIGRDELRLVARTGLSAWPVYVALLWHARESGRCYPSVRTLSQLLSTPVRTIHRQLARLEAAGVIRRQSRRGRATVYRLLGAGVETTPAATSGVEPVPNLAAVCAESGTKAVPHPAAKEYSENNTNEERWKKPRSPSDFFGPGLPDVTALWIAEKLRGTPQRFHDYYAARGWRGIVDWRAAARLWSSREREDPSAVRQSPVISSAAVDKAKAMNNPQEAREARESYLREIAAGMGLKERLRAQLADRSAKES